MFFIRSFNRFINSKTGHPLPEGSYRGDHQPWKKFETLLKEVITELGYEYTEQLETPRLPTTAAPDDIQIHAHKTKRDLPDADFFYMQMHLKELFTLDTQGWGADHSKSKKKTFIESVDLESAEALRLQLLNNFTTSGDSKHPQPQIGSKAFEEEPFNVNSNYILVPLQTPRDYVLEHHADLSVLAFVKIVADWAIAQKTLVCFKIHPYSLKDISIKETLERYAKASQFISLSSRNIHELINASSGLFVINSGVGFEGLIHGKPVVTFGNCDYKLATFAADKHTINSAKDYILNYTDEQQAFASRFVYNYYTNHAFSLADDFIQDSKLRLKQYLEKQLQEDSLKARVQNTSSDNNHSEGSFDVVYVSNEANQNWILGALCREIDRYHSGSSHYHHVEDGPPPTAKAYFFTHYTLWHQCIADYPWLRMQRSLVFFTHPSSLQLLHPKVITSLNQASKVICMCSAFSQFLVKQGVSKSLIEVCLLGADTKLFKPHSRGNGIVGFCSSFYERKNPELIVEIIKQMPHRKFLLLGRKWQEYEYYSELINLENFSYIEADYADYPEYYAKMDVFVSPSKLEGGPIPLIESMMCNAVPVASNTGFSQDLIVNGENGFIFNVDEPVSVVCDLIEEAYTLRGDISKTVEHLTWERTSRQIQSLFQDDGNHRHKLALLYKFYDLANQRAENYERANKQLRSEIKKLEAKPRKLEAKLRKIESRARQFKSKLKKLEADSKSLKCLLSRSIKISRRKLKDRIRQSLKINSK